jgi:hypothetical protein
LIKEPYFLINDCHESLGPLVKILVAENDDSFIFYIFAHEVHFDCGKKPKYLFDICLYQKCVTNLQVKIGLFSSGPSLGPQLADLRKHHHGGIADYQMIFFFALFKHLNEILESCNMFVFVQVHPRNAI